MNNHVNIFQGCPSCMKHILYETLPSHTIDTSYKFQPICDPGPQNQSYVSSCDLIYVIYTSSESWKKQNKNQHIEKIAFKVVQMKLLAMHITKQKLSFDIFTVSLWSMNFT